MNHVLYKTLIGTMTGITLGCALTQIQPTEAYADTNPYSPTHIVINGTNTSNPLHIVAKDPSNPKGPLTTWVPMYYLQSALNTAGLHASWNGQDLEINVPTSWTVNTANARQSNKLPSSQMDFIVKGKNYQISPRKVVKDPASGVNTTYVPVYYVNQFLKQVLSMQTSWDGSNWTLVTQDALVPDNVVTSTMRATTEVRQPDEYFTPFPNQVVTSDGNGGVLTAIGGTRFPTADGLGQLVFFFHNGKVVGVNSDVEVTAIKSIKSIGVGKFAITYVNYKSTDPMVNPSLPPQTVTYSWNGSALVPSASLVSGVTLGNVKISHSW